MQRISNTRTLKLELQSTEVYFPYIACVFYRRSIKIHAGNIEASKFVCFCRDGKLFLKISQMLVVCICYCYNIHIFLSFPSESRVARNTILLQMDVLGLDDGVGANKLLLR